MESFDDVKGQRDMRLFIGIKTDCESYLSSLQNELKKIGKGSFTDAANLHITLRFIGEVPVRRLRDIYEAISEIEAEPFELACEEVFIFKRSRTVSAKVGGEVRQLAAIYQSLENALEKKGFEKAKREFSPHITLVRNFNVSSDNVPESIPHSVCRFTVDEIILFESRQTTGKNEYVPLFVKKLKDGST